MSTTIRLYVSILLLSLILVPSSTLAQPWMEGVSSEERDNFYVIQEAFENYWKDHDPAEKGKGWKPFKRWEWFWEQRVSPSGEFPNRAQLYEEYMKARQRKARKQQAALAAWTELGPDASTGGYSGLGRLNCVMTDPDDIQTIWVGAAAGGIWKSTDAGLTWATKTDLLPSLGVTDIVIDPTNTDIMYIATGDGDAADDYSVGVMKSIDGGETWSATGLTWATSEAHLLSRLLINPDDPSTLIAAGNGIYRTTDAGDTWILTNSLRMHDLEFKPGDPNIVYASGAFSDVYRSTDGGATWIEMTNLPANGRRVAIAVTPANPEYIYALFSNTSSGYLGTYRSTNSGDSWTYRSGSPNLLGWDVNGGDSGGQGWYDLAIAVSPTDADEVYTGGVNVWKSIDGGTSWTINTMWYAIGGIPNIHADQHNLWFVPGTTTLFAVNDGGIYRTTDNGESWSWLGSGLRITMFYRLGVSQSDPGRMIAGTQDNGTKLLIHEVWTDEIGGDGMEALIDYSDEDIMYGTLYFGDIYRSMNGGISWTVVSGGISESGGWITPYVIHPTDPATLIAGYQHVWRTTDRGSSWSEISNFGGSTLSLLAISDSDPEVIYAGTGWTMYRTTDGGKTDWTPIGRPVTSGFTTDLEIHPLNPDHIWQTSSGYVDGEKVYESTDAGDTWTNISGSLPNVPANCIVYQKNSPDRVYVGTDIGVYYRDQTTGDWEDYNDGMANVTISELEIQHSTNKLVAATYGRGMWETDAVVNTGAVIGLSRTSIDFGNIEAGTTSDPAEVDITNVGAEDTLTVSSISLSGDGFNLIGVPSFPLEIPPGETSGFEVAFSPAFQADFLDSITIVSDATNATTLWVTLAGKGVVIDEAAVDVLYAAKDSLYVVDARTGEMTVAGETGIGEVHSLAVHPETKELFGASTDLDETSIFRFSSSTGAALHVATFDIPYMRAITFGPEGQLYGAVAYGTSAGTLFGLDPATGESTEIGTSGVIYSSLAFSPFSGQLWASERPPVGTKDRIYTVDTSTGEATLIGQTGFPLRITAAIAFQADGGLLGITGNGPFENQLVEIDTATAEGELLGDMGIWDLSAVTMRIDSLTVSVDQPAASVLPEEYVLQQNYPNPFNPVTEIRYALPVESRVRMIIYDVLGQEIGVLVDEQQAAGHKAVRWNGRDKAGSTAASGLYFYRMVATRNDGTTFTDIKKMLLIR